MWLMASGKPHSNVDGSNEEDNWSGGTGEMLCSWIFHGPALLVGLIEHSEWMKMQVKKKKKVKITEGEKRY